jgi:hypothetical protein
MRRRLRRNLHYQVALISAIACVVFIRMDIFPASAASAFKLSAPIAICVGNKPNVYLKWTRSQTDTTYSIQKIKGAVNPFTRFGNTTKEDIASNGYIDTEFDAAYHDEYSYRIISYQNDTKISTSNSRTVTLPKCDTTNDFKVKMGDDYKLTTDGKKDYTSTSTPAETITKDVGLSEIGKIDIYNHTKI